MEALFGNNTPLTLLQNACFRLPAVAMSAFAVIILTELGSRVLENSPIQPSWKFKDDGYMLKVKQFVTDQVGTSTLSSFRPLGKKVTKTSTSMKGPSEEFEYTNKSLIKALVINVVISNLLFEFTRTTGGELPPIYNQVARWITPLRLSGEPHPIIAVLSSVFARPKANIVS
jgi:hypothetical protein